MRIVFHSIRLKHLGLAAVLLAAMTTTASAQWSSFVIRNASSDNSAPQINNLAGGVTEFVITKGGQKAGLGTNSLDGTTIGSISSISIDRVDDYTRFAVGSGPYVAPYINMWITDGTGDFAVVANEPSNPEWTGNDQWNMDWNTLKTKTAKIYEYNTGNTAWLPNAGVGPFTFSQFAGYTIQAPTVAELTAGWTGLSTGAPRTLGTNQAYGFNWVFGDTLSNYVSGDPGYQVKDASLAGAAPTPEPMSLMLAGLGLSAVAGLRRKSRTA